MLNVLVVCGGQSAEHEVSLRSAQTVIDHLDQSLYVPHVVIIDVAGLWHYHGCKIGVGESLCFLKPTSSGAVLHTDSGDIAIDIAFPVLHGPYGEDGTIQGFFEILGLPYVGAGVTASALGMDKVLFKMLMQNNNIPVVPFLWGIKGGVPTYQESCARLETNIFFIKPSTMGSSIGISKVMNAAAYDQAIHQALQYSATVLIEAAVKAQEIECALLGNDPYDVTDMCAVHPTHDFYSYEAKYIDPQGATFDFFPVLSSEQRQRISEIAQKAAAIIGCKGLARVDFFVTEKGVYLNEINTMPGFTSISMYPQLWQRKGVSIAHLISRLIALAQQHFSEKNSLKKCTP